MGLTYSIGVDLGGTKLDIASIDSEGKILARRLMPTDVQGGSKAIIQQIVKAVEELGRALSIGIGLPGQVDPVSGRVLFAPNLNWKDVPIKNELEALLGLPVHITNDVRAAAFGEWQIGAGRGYQDLACIFVGTGIGSGIVSAGKMIEGEHYSAGEIGHTVIQMDGRLCSCGQRGHFEAYASGWAITQIAKELIKKDAARGKAILQHAGGIFDKVTTREVMAAFKEQDPLAKEIVDGAIRALIAGGVNVVNTINPKKLIFGGGVIRGAPELLGPIQEGIKLGALASATKGLEVSLTGLGSDAGVIGAALFGLKSSQ